MKKMIVTMLLITFTASAAFAATAYRKALTDEAGAVMQVLTPDPIKAYTQAEATAKGTYCFDTTNVIQLKAQSTRTTTVYPNTATTRTFPLAANTVWEQGVARYGAGSTHTVTQVCFTNQSGASLAIIAQ